MSLGGPGPKRKRRRGAAGFNPSPPPPYWVADRVGGIFLVPLSLSRSSGGCAAAIANGIGREIVKPYDTPLGNPIRSLVFSEKFFRERPEVAARVLKCFVEATKTLIEQPEVAEKYVREVVFNRYLSHESYVEAMGNSSFTYDQTVEHVQTTIDYMVRFGLLSTPNPPPAGLYVKLDLLAAAKRELGVK